MNLNDDINSFIRHVESYLRQHQLFRLRGATEGMNRGHGRHATDFAKDVVSIQEQQNEHRAHFTEIGNRLARDMEASGINAADVLLIISYATGGGGAMNIYPLWDAVKVDLQRITMRPTNAGNWLTDVEAANIVGVTRGNIGKQAGPQGSGKPIIDNGVKGAGRRFSRVSVDAYAARRNAKARKSASAEESDADVNRKFREAT